jgi:ABC-2 type transport system ATP-binding protein
MSDPVIRCEGVTRRFGSRTALDDISLAVQPGRCFGFLGPNGAGKTTLIRCILGLARPTAGRITVRGHDIAREPGAALARVGAIVEEPRFYGYLSGRQNLELWAAYTGGAARERVEPVLDRVGLMPRAGDKVSAYSLGMRQRLGVARALLSDPELLVLDEPTNGLDPDGVAEFRLLIRDLVETDGRAVFVSSHLLDEIQKVCDDLAIVNHGRLLMSGSLEELLESGASSLRIECDDGARARNLLDTLPGVTAIAVEPSGVLAVRLDPDTATTRAAINRHLVEAGLGVSRLEPRSESLEERYLALVHEEAQA